MEPDSLTNLADRLASVQERVAAASQRTGRDPSEVELVAVSKTHPVEMIREAMEAGIGLFGESRVQEASAKIPLLPGRLRWHFIGHLQANKVRKALPLFELFHSVDTMELARDINRVAGEMGLFPRVLLEINVSGEGSKYGMAPEAVRTFLHELLELPRLQVEGLMTMAPLAADPEASRPYFTRLRKLRDQLAAEAGIPLTTLSMGMSGDYEIAIEEGATLVRVGTAIFGRR